MVFTAGGGGARGHGKQQQTVDLCLHGERNRTVLTHTHTNTHNWRFSFRLSHRNTSETAPPRLGRLISLNEALDPFVPPP